MTEIKLNSRQAALVLEVAAEGEIIVEVAAPHSSNDNKLAVSVCQVIATKLTNDEQFQESIIAALSADENEG